MTVLPGLTNTHIHCGYDEELLAAWAEGGVTTVRDLGLRTGDPAEIEACTHSVTAPAVTQEWRA